MSGFWSSETMKERLKNNIDPFDESRIVNCSYELSMGSQAYVTSSKKKTRHQLNTGEQLRIPPGQLAQLLTRECVKIPNYTLGLISMKSNLKLRGLVNISGFHVDPGYKGRLLFSVYNAGAQDVCISEGTPVFLLWLSSLDSPTKDVYKGNRAGTCEISDKDIMLIQGTVFTPQALAERVESLDKRVENIERSRRFRNDIIVRIIIGITGAVMGGLIVGLIKAF